MLRSTDHFRNAGEDLAVVDFHHHGDAELGEYLVGDLNQLCLVDERGAADDVGVALVEFTVAAFLRAVGAPDGLHLVTLERECDLVLVLHHKTGEGHREVVAQALLAELGGQFVD